MAAAQNHNGRYTYHNLCHHTELTTTSRAHLLKARQNVPRYIKTENFQSKWKNRLPTLRLATNHLQSTVETEAPSSNVANGNETLLKYR